METDHCKGPHSHLFHIEEEEEREEEKGEGEKGLVLLSCGVAEAEDMEEVEGRQERQTHSV